MKGTIMNVDSKKNKMYLEDKDAALVFTEDGDFTFAIPKQEDDEIVPEYVRYCIGLAILWKKDNTREILMKMIDDVYEEFVNCSDTEEEPNENNEGC
jgi:hypothetical protein